MKILKMVLICMAVMIPVAFGAFYYGRNVESHRSAMEIHEVENHGEREHEEHEEKDHESLKSEPIHQDEDHILLSEDQIRALGIATAKAGPGTLETVLTLPGEIVLNDDNVALVTPYVSGYVKEIRKRQGDPVLKGRGDGGPGKP